MEQISKNFNMSEFSATSTGLPNDIPESTKPAIRHLVSNLLQPLCDAFHVQCKINSGYRSPAVNRAVGGAGSSQHTEGEAADTVYYRLDTSGVRMPLHPIEVLKELLDKGLLFDQAIVYPSFLHLSLSISGVNRKQILYNKTYKGERL